MNKFINFIVSREVRYRTDFTFLVIVFGVVYLQFLGFIPLIEPDEGRYAEIPREMLERADFVTPLLNYVKYFEKPPLIYWLNAVSMKIFGENEFAARLPSALCGILTILLVYHLGRKLFGRREGFLAASILGSCTGFMVQSRIILTDMALTCCLSAALGCFILAAQEEEKRKGLYYHLFYCFAALSVLAKGLIGILLPGLIILAFVLLSRRWRLLLEMRLLSGTLLFLLVAAPWFVLVSLRNAEFANFFFIHEHFERFLSKVHGRYQPIWYFLPVLFGGMLPWSFLIPSTFRDVWRYRQKRDGEAALFLTLWCVLIFLFFSKSNSKLAPYILPVFPAVALLMGRMFSRLFDGDLTPLKVPVQIMGILLVVVGFGGTVYPFVAADPVVSRTGGVVIGFIFIFQGIIALVCAQRKDVTALFIGLVGTSLALMLAGPPFVLTNIASFKSLKGLGQAVLREVPPDAAVVSQGVMQGLSFYSRRRVIIFDGAGELEFGSQQGEPQGWFINRPDFYALWDSDRPVYAVVWGAFLPELQKNTRNSYRVVTKNAMHVLVVNR